MNSFQQPLKTQPMFILSLVGIYLLSAFLQSKTFIGWDISNGLIEAEKLIQGGIYGKDFFEPSPPMFLLLYAVPVLISQWLSLKIIWIFPLFVFFLTTITLKCCYPFIGRMFNEDDIVLKQFLLLLLAAILMLMPIASDFGQREHLLIIFILPYIFLMGERFQKKFVSLKKCIFIGIWAGLGFAIKPFFLIGYIMLEYAYAWRTDNLFAWWRAESIVILFWIAFIYAITLIFFPTYFTEVIPHVLPFYYASYAEELSLLLQLSYFIFCLLVLATFYGFFHKSSLMALQISIIGFLISFLMQQTSWFYHLYPAYSLATLNLGMLFIIMLQDKLLWHKTKWSMFALFTCIDFFVLLKVHYFQLYIYLFVTLLILGGIFLIFFRKLHLSQWVPAFFLAQILFLMPCLSGIGQYKTILDFYTSTSAIRNFIMENASHKPIYFLSRHLPLEFPSISYTTAKHVSRFSAIFWLTGYVNQRINSKTPAGWLYFENEKKYFVNAISEELQQTKPSYVFVELIQDSPFKILTILQSVASFKQIWENYYYLTLLNENTLRPVAVYQLKES